MFTTYLNCFFKSLYTHYLNLIGISILCIRERSGPVFVFIIPLSYLYEAYYCKMAMETL